MEEKDFNFDKVGKNMPYIMPNNFVNDITTSTMLKINKRKRVLLKRKIMTIAASIIVIFTLSLIFIDNNSSRQYNKYRVEKMINEMSDSDLATIISITEDDIMVNEEL